MTIKKRKLILPADYLNFPIFCYLLISEYHDFYNKNDVVIKHCSAVKADQWSVRWYGWERWKSIISVFMPFFFSLYSFWLLCSILMLYHVIILYSSSFFVFIHSFLYILGLLLSILDIPNSNTSIRQDRPWNTTKFVSFETKT